MLTVKAYAKINIILEVLRKRNDGYHDIASIIQTINIYDVLSFVKARDIELICNNPDLDSPENLVVKAARLLQETTHCKQGATIHLQKKIPVAAGLGGGSSDAAVTLLALNELWGLHFPVSHLHHMASHLGFDVPFFLYGGTALVEGRGDWVTPLPSLSPLLLILLHPDIIITNKTQELYNRLNPRQFTSGNLVHLATEQLRHEKSLSSIQCFNVFETVASQVFPSLEEYRHKLMSAGATAVYLSGSGPTMFSIMANQDNATKMVEELQQSGLNAYLTRTVEKSELETYSNKLVMDEEEINYV